MTEIVANKKEYKFLLKRKNIIDSSLSRFFIKKVKSAVFLPADLLRLPELGLKGGPKDLSANFDKYLYS